MPWYVYGIVGRDVEVLPEARGVGDPPAPVELVVDGSIAALVSEVPPERPLGTGDDLLNHQRLLDATVLDTPVLPVRFGAVLAEAKPQRSQAFEPGIVLPAFRQLMLGPVGIEQVGSDGKCLLDDLANLVHGEPPVRPRTAPRQGRLPIAVEPHGAVCVDVAADHPLGVGPQPRQVLGVAELVLAHPG